MRACVCVCVCVCLSNETVFRCLWVQFIISCALPLGFVCKMCFVDDDNDVGFHVLGCRVDILGTNCNCVFRKSRKDFIFQINPTFILHPSRINTKTQLLLYTLYHIYSSLAKHHQTKKWHISHPHANFLFVYLKTNTQKYVYCTHSVGGMKASGSVIPDVMS